VAACEEEALSAAPPIERAPAAARVATLAIPLVAAALLAIRLDVPAYFDNEGRYAEVAREMVLRGDWISPHLDFTLFLNKPPLTFWLAALVFRVAGATEWARLVSIGAAAVALFATCRLGALLYGGAAGAVAGIALATSVGFVLEARTLRPDMLVVAAVAIALWSWRAALAAPRGPARTYRLVALYAALGLGVLAKGLVPIAIAAVPIGVLTLRERGWRGIAALRPGLGLLVTAVIVVPWHAVVAARHPGFAWDYVLNQHLLFFLDKKLPRDSEGDPLGFFWAAFLGRAAPWALLLPLTLAEAVRGARRTASAGARATFLLWAWVGGTLLFFSLAPSRLEHYSLPALPAAALLAARVWQRARRDELAPAAWPYLAAAGGVAAIAGAVGLVAGRRLLARTYWLVEVPEFLSLAAPAAATLAAVGVALAVGAVRRRPDWVVGALALAAVPVALIVLRAEAAAEPLFSWRPLARALVASVPADVDVFFQSPEEYQLVGGLAYYADRRIVLLEPPGFVPPAYLAGLTDRIFVPRPELERRWRAGERLALVSDPQQRRDTPDGLAPSPFHVLGRFGDRWLLASFDPSAGR
jgi:4-amino-4-deoxy-L-arabinose transferase-like glycosyltransferase